MRTYFYCRIIFSSKIYLTLNYPWICRKGFFGIFFSLFLLIFRGVLFFRVFFRGLIFLCLYFRFFWIFLETLAEKGQVQKTWIIGFLELLPNISFLARLFLVFFPTWTNDLNFIADNVEITKTHFWYQTHTHPVIFQKSYPNGHFSSLSQSYESGGKYLPDRKGYFWNIPSYPNIPMVVFLRVMSLGVMTFGIFWDWEGDPYSVDVGGFREGICFNIPILWV